MTLQIKKATKSESKLRLNLTGSSGAGKTYSGLSIAENLGKNILVVDTEKGSASKYADIFAFDVIELTDFAPENFIQAINLGESNGYDVIFIDSLTHEWNGTGGILEIHSAEEKITRNKFTAWAKVTPRHNALIEAIVQCKIHIITTMRAKTDYSMNKDERGKTTVENVGLAPIQREGMEYEFDVVLLMDQEHNAIVQKTRCPTLSGKVFNRPGTQIAEILKVWLMGVPETKVRMPETPQKLEIVKAESVSADSPKSDYTEDWNQKLSQPTAPRPIEAAPVSPETSGRLFYQAGYVSRTAKGYEVSEMVFGEKVVFEITKTNGIVSCTCPDYRDGITDVENYFCAHKWAMKFHYENHGLKQAA